MPDSRRPRAKYEYYVEHPDEYRRGRGLNSDYYEGHPLDRRRPGRYHDDAYDRPSSSKMDQALVALQDGNFRGALAVVKPRSKSMSAPRSRSSNHSHSHSDSRRRREPSYSPSPDRRRRHRSTYDDDEDRSRARSSRRPASRRRSSSAGVWEQVAGAALVAGAAEAYRVRREPGGWTSGKGARIATAAIGAAAIDAGIDRNPNKHAKRHVAESAIGGLLVNRLANGSRDHPHRRRW